MAPGASAVRRAIELDPAFAEPHAHLAFGHFISGMHGLQPFREVAPAARAEAIRALELDPSDPAPRVVLGAIALAFDYDWQAGEEHFRAALSSPSVPAEGRWLYASLYLGAVGRFDESSAEMEKAAQQDPLNPNWHSIWSAHLTNAQQHERAVEESLRAVALDTDYWGTQHILGEAWLACGRTDEAMAAFQKAHRAAPWNAMSAGMLAAMHRRRGDHTEADRMLEAIGEAPQPVWGRVLYHLHTGEIDAAALWYERMIAHGDPFALVYASAPVTRPLHAHPRWPALAARMRLPV